MARTYRSALRAEQAERTRAAVITAAAECFLARGYAETTMKDIAARAGVSPPTVYAQGNKAALLLAAVDWAIRGDAVAEPLIQHDRIRRLLTERNKQRKLCLLRDISVDFLPRITPMMRTFWEAASDPELAGAWEEYERRRYSDILAIVESFAHLLRPGLTVEHATDIYWATFSQQTPDMFLRLRGWTIEEYVDWMVDAMDRLLLQ